MNVVLPVEINPRCSYLDCYGMILNRVTSIKSTSTHSKSYSLLPSLAFEKRKSFKPSDRK